MPARMKKALGYDHVHGFMVHGRTIGSRGRPAPLAPRSPRDPRRPRGRDAWQPRAQTSKSSLDEATQGLPINGLCYCSD